jgi:hypothetical protein
MNRLAPLVRVAVGAVVGILLLGGCWQTSDGTSSGGGASLQSASRPPNRRVTKLLVVVEENHSLTQMRSGMPYTLGLAKRFGYATDYHAVAHPSLPDYLAIVGGSTYGVHDDADPSEHPISGRSIFGQALAHHRTAALFADAMPRPCALHDDASYAVRHNPWTYFVQESAACAAHDLPMSAFADTVAAGDLPRVGLVVPDLGHDAHDGTLASADEWFRSLMNTVFSGPDWNSGHLAVVLTADEDDGTYGNRVLTVVVHPSQRHRVVRRPMDHFALTRLYADVAHLRPLRYARTAPSMAVAFGLPVD